MAELAYQTGERVALAKALEGVNPSFAKKVGDAAKTPFEAIDGLVNGYFTQGPGKGKEFLFESPLRPTEIYERISDSNIPTQVGNEHRLLAKVLEQYAPEKVAEDPDGFMQRLDKAKGYSAEFEQGVLAGYLTKLMQEKKVRFDFKKIEAPKAEAPKPASIDEIASGSVTLRIRDGKGRIHSVTAYVTPDGEYGSHGKILEEAK